jgi:hypothetical protein
MHPGGDGFGRVTLTLVTASTAPFVDFVGIYP